MESLEGKPKALVTGLPGSGKTTLVKRFIEKFSENVVGFYTEEIRVKGRRVGFMLKTTWGDERVFSHVEFKSPYRVSKYGVDVKVIDEVVRDLLKRWNREILVIDEVGKMELLSRSFRAFVKDAVSGDHSFLFTVPERSRDPIVLDLKRRFPVFHVSRDGGEDPLGKIVSMFSSCFHS